MFIQSYKLGMLSSKFNGFSGRFQERLEKIDDFFEKFDLGTHLPKGAVDPIRIPGGLKSLKDFDKDDLFDKGPALVKLKTDKAAIEINDASTNDHGKNALEDTLKIEIKATTDPVNVELREVVPGVNTPKGAIDPIRIPDGVDNKVKVEIKNLSEYNKDDIEDSGPATV